MRSPSFLPQIMVYFAPALNTAHYTAFSSNSPRRRRYCKPTKSRDPVDLLEKLRLGRKLRPSFQHVTN